MKYSIVLAFILFFGCSESDDKLFWISNTDHDLLQMAESTNVAVLSGDSLQLFLSDREQLLLDSATTYKNFGKIYSTKKYNLYVLLRSTSSHGRDYRFLLRTYTPQWKLIDSFQLATWNERLEEYCTGYIDNKLAIRRLCKNQDVTHRMQINDDGKILVSVPSNAQ